MQKTAYEMRSSDWRSDVCSSDLLDECLHHEGFDPHLPEQFGERGKVRAIRADTKDRAAGITVQRLEDDIAMFGLKGADFVQAAGDERDRTSTRLNSSH